MDRFSIDLYTSDGAGGCGTYVTSICDKSSIGCKDSGASSRGCLATWRSPTFRESGFLLPSTTSTSVVDSTRNATINLVKRLRGHFLVGRRAKMCLQDGLSKNLHALVVETARCLAHLAWVISISSLHVMHGASPYSSGRCLPASSPGGDYDVEIPCDTPEGEYSIRVGRFEDPSLYSCSETFSVVGEDSDDSEDSEDRSMSYAF